MEIGEGDTILFWHHWWIGDKSLSVMFPRLFYLSNNQRGTIKSMGDWVDEKCEWKLSWNRELSGRDLEQANTLHSLINRARANAAAKDGWRWKPSPNGCFSVKTAYKVLCSEKNPTVHPHEDNIWSLIWKAAVPFKTRTTAWRILKGRLPTCDELQKRQVSFQNADILCGFCKVKDETINHTFFECFKADEVWKEILRWIGKQTTMNHKAKEHLLAFINLGNKDDSHFLLVVWLCTIWCIWKERNVCKFNQGVWRKEKLVAEIKTRIWGWMEAFKMQRITSDFRRWFTEAKLHG
ncbi:uncharacterized protein LOC131025608 [Salvia miltiorrhiza]|uniref:uncharacterized protein LOC131025608 n=1 Tax=Salvia miltiorrhiza TaxID=226208 RepID=UPI0025ABB0A5|nr:uncharacterized protein LOC131025608 [Salvia miltiorrhiza]